MENATKALVMAGGVLIAIMVIAALIYAYGTFQVIPKTQDESAEVRQLSLFNQQYESYARGAIYGTDLISVLNKARDNNQRYNVTKPEERMYIEIKFTLLTDLEETKKEYKEYLSGPNKGKLEETDEVSSKVVMKKSETEEDGYFLSELSNLPKSNDMREFFDRLLDVDNNSGYNPKTDTPKGTFIENGIRYRKFLRNIPDTSEFKTRIFECKYIGYDGEGRINYMWFIEYVEKTNSPET